MTEKSLDLIKNFVDERLNKNIDNLGKFNFTGLEGNETYDGCPKGSFDADNTKLAKAIYYVIWKDELPDLKTIEDIGTGKKYRGDTLNTFTTLFGKKENEETFYSRAQKFGSDDDEFKELVSQFRSEFLTIGNFMLLPNLSQPYAKTINMYRGSWFVWCDFFDRFLLELKYCLTNDIKQDQIFKKLIDENSFYFKNDKLNTIQKFSDINFLEKYFMPDGDVEVFFKPHYYPRVCSLIKSPTKEQKEEYKEYAKNYIAKATEVIDYRASNIIEKLKSKL